MTIKDIKTGRWYETRQGTGLCTRVGGTRPPSIMVDIRLPMPRGRVNLTARDVIREVPDPTK